MRTLEAFYQKASPYALSVLRIMTGLLFMEHGLQKLFNFPPGGMFMPPLYSFMWVGGMLELYGGGLLALGFFTRPVAFLLAGEMAVAYFKYHAAPPASFYPVTNHGEMAVLYCFVFLYLWFAGAGPISIDWLFRRTAQTPLTMAVPEGVEL